MPDDKFNFAPTQGEFKGVRTFAQQIKHIAAVNYMMGAAIMSEKPPVNVGSENGPDNLTSKADIVKFLKDSFAYLHKALGTLDENNILGQVQSPFGSNKVSPPWADRDCSRPSLRSLRPDGRLPAHERHRSARQPPVVESGNYSAIRGATISHLCRRLPRISTMSSNISLHDEAKTSRASRGFSTRT